MGEFPLSGSKSILRSQQFDRERLQRIFSLTDTVKKLQSTDAGRKLLKQTLSERQAFLVFYEPSTRTRFSFNTAALQLGMDIVETENAGEFSSAIKGETLEDTIRVMCEYHPSVIVLRHPENGSAERAATVSESYGIHLINGGDGKGQHPTQALLDIYTVQAHFGRLDELTVVLGGDLKNGRTIRSLAYLLSKFEKIRCIFVAPPSLQIGQDILEHLEEHRIPYEITDNLHSVLPAADVVYWTRIQRERMSDAEKNIGSMLITEQEMKLLKPKSILMHPLPRVDEIRPEVDKDPRAIYFAQAGNGVPLRMALFLEMFDVKL